MRLYHGTWKSNDRWRLLKEGGAVPGGVPEHPINPKFVEPLKAVEVNDSILGKINVPDLVLKRLAQMSEPTVLFDPFTGPIKDQTGTVRIKAGERAGHDQLWSMDWLVEGVVGNLPK